MRAYFRKYLVNQANTINEGADSPVGESASKIGVLVELVGVCKQDRNSYQWPECSLAVSTAFSVKPSHDTFGFQSLNMPLGFFFQAQTWSS